MANLFVYGTLTIPELLYTLIKKEFKTEDAILKNYKRYKIYDNGKERPYPAIIKEANSFVKGKIIFDIDKKSLDILNFFEGDDYIKKEETVYSNGKSYPAFVYVWKENNKSVLKNEWDASYFRNKYLDLYINKKIPDILDEYYK